MRIGYKVEVQVKALQKPDYNGGNQNDGKGALEKIFGLFPKKLKHITRTGETIIRKFHDEGDSFTAKQGVFEKKCDENPQENPQKVECCHNYPTKSGEESTYKEGINRQLRGTAHERCQQNCHLAVTLAGEGTC